MTDVSISLDLKQQLIDFYEETKKAIDNHLLNLTNEMKKVKNQHELLYKKALEILIFFFFSIFALFKFKTKSP